LSGIIVLGAALRLAFIWDLPLNGEDMVSVLQATGHAADYPGHSLDGVTPMQQVRCLIDDDPRRSPIDVLRSMRFAGMHPPFYYLLLHYFIRFAGSAALPLKGLSVLFSLLSILCLYQLARYLADERTALLAALLQALAGYDVWLAAQVRPYPLMMLLSLLTTWQAIRLHADPPGGAVRPGSPRLYLYAATVLAGLYALYHFLFVFLSQLVFLVTQHRSRRPIVALILVCLVVSAGYLPWLSGLRDQVHTVTAGDYYFHDKPDLIHFAADVSSLNCARFFRIPSLPLKAAITLAFAVLAGLPALFGVVRLYRGRVHRPFLVALVAYLVFYVAIEKALGVTSFHKPKMLFFVMPLLFFFLAHGLPRRTEWRTVVLAVLCAALLANTLAACLRPAARLDGDEGYLRVFPTAVRQNVQPSQRALLVVNTSARRYLLALAHALPRPVDTLVLPSGQVPLGLPTPEQVTSYDVILLASLDTSYAERGFTPQQVQSFSQVFATAGFTPTQHYDTDYKPLPKTLVVFSRLAPPTPTASPGPQVW